ncbi:uncharacterized protein MELLADRAFT_102359 [Melampsora larici-populina 98AG31]|uniref:Uncharacterized protein n=1 Tax=Melampsora larici-populina (strain 98AG31 / pathotype 3-4-7) TaxID=747676 RepID=F4R812_MELLP|nr:uncharacterized protein MELLADRAFT_102359 [Melampsora larici-populina 98AG31]EGG11413.1 hypothetical protein MELLADRAFT_102359 [Melampsora larici-populina 98AG31]
MPSKKAKQDPKKKPVRKWEQFAGKDTTMPDVPAWDMTCVLNIFGSASTKAHKLSVYDHFNLVQQQWYNFQKIERADKTTPNGVDITRFIMVSNIKDKPTISANTVCREIGHIKMIARDNGKGDLSSIPSKRPTSKPTSKEPSRMTGPPSLSQIGCSNWDVPVSRILTVVLAVATGCCTGALGITDEAPSTASFRYEDFEIVVQAPNNPDTKTTLEDIQACRIHIQYDKGHKVTPHGVAQDVFELAGCGDYSNNRDWVAQKLAHSAHAVKNGTADCYTGCSKTDDLAARQLFANLEPFNLDLFSKGGLGPGAYTDNPYGSDVKKIVAASESISSASISKAPQKGQKGSKKRALVEEDKATGEEGEEEMDHRHMMAFNRKCKAARENGSSPPLWVEPPPSEKTLEWLPRGGSQNLPSPHHFKRKVTPGCLYWTERGESLTSHAAICTKELVAEKLKPGPFECDYKDCKKNVYESEGPEDSPLGFA